MDATTVATAGVHPGDTLRLRAFSRFEKTRDLALLARLVKLLENSGIDSPALARHRAARDRVQRELAQLSAQYAHEVRQGVVP